MAVNGNAFVSILTAIAQKHKSKTVRLASILSANQKFRKLKFKYFTQCFVYRGKKAVTTT